MSPERQNVPWGPLRSPSLGRLWSGGGVEEAVRQEGSTEQDSVSFPLYG